MVWSIWEHKPGGGKGMGADGGGDGGSTIRPRRVRSKNKLKVRKTLKKRGRERVMWNLLPKLVGGKI